MYDDINHVFGSLDDQRDQVASILNSKSLEPKTVLLQAYRCAMTTKPHMQTTLTEYQFYDFAVFVGYANGSAIPLAAPISTLGILDSHQRSHPQDNASPSPRTADDERANQRMIQQQRQRFFRTIGRSELKEIYDVCVRSQGFMNDHAFVLAIAHMHLTRYISEDGKRPEVGSKSIRMTLSEAAERLAGYVKPRTQPFPFPFDYYDDCSTVLRSLWRYSEGLEGIFRSYSNSEVFERRSCEKCLVDVGVIPQLSPQVVDRLFEQSRERFPDGASGLSVDGFFELLARVACALYADDVFSRRITLESKVEHLISTVIGAAYATLYGVSLPHETEEVPYPLISRIEPKDINESTREVTVHGEYFGALGRGLWVATSLSPHIAHIPAARVAENCVVIPIHCGQTIPWDTCTVMSNPAIHRLFNFTFSHKVKVTFGNSVEDTMCRSAILENLLSFQHSVMTVTLSQATLDTLETVFKDGCAQLAYNKGNMYDYCWEYVCAHYRLGIMVSITNPCALGVSLSDVVSTDVVPGDILSKLFAAYAVWKEPNADAGSAPRCALTLHTFAEILARMAMATGCAVDAAEDVVKDMLRPMDFVEQQLETGINHAIPSDAVDSMSAASRRATAGRLSMSAMFLSPRDVGERRSSEFGVFNEELQTNDAASPGFRQRIRSFRENETILRTVANEKRVVKVLKQANADLKAKLDIVEQRREVWRATRADVQKTMAQIRGVLEVVLPPEMKENVQITSKLAVVYRKQLLEACERVGVAMEMSESDASGATGLDMNVLKDLLKQQVDDIKKGNLSKQGSNQKDSHSKRLSNIGPPPVNPIQAQLDAAKAQLESQDEIMKEKDHRIEDLEKLVIKVRQDREKTERDITTLRSVMMQLRQSTDSDLAKMRGVLADRGEVIRSMEQDKNRLDKANKALEGQLSIKRQEITRLEDLQKKKEDALESLSGKLSEALSKNITLMNMVAMSGASSGGSISIEAPKDNDVKESPASKDEGGAKKKKQSAVLSRPTAAAVVMKELEAIRNAEKELLRNQAASARDEYEKEVREHELTKGALEESRARQIQLADEVLRMYNVLSNIEKATAQQVADAEAQAVKAQAEEDRRVAKLLHFKQHHPEAAGGGNPAGVRQEGDGDPPASRPTSPLMEGNERLSLTPSGSPLTPTELNTSSVTPRDTSSSSSPRDSLVPPANAMASRNNSAVPGGSGGGGSNVRRGAPPPHLAGVAAGLTFLKSIQQSITLAQSMQIPSTEVVPELPEHLKQEEYLTPEEAMAYGLDGFGSSAEFALQQQSMQSSQLVPTHPSSQGSRPQTGEPQSSRIGSGNSNAANYKRRQHPTPSNDAQRQLVDGSAPSPSTTAAATGGAQKWKGAIEKATQKKQPGAGANSARSPERGVPATRLLSEPHSPKRSTSSADSTLNGSSSGNSRQPIPPQGRPPMIPTDGSIAHPPPPHQPLALPAAFAGMSRIPARLIPVKCQTCDYLRFILKSHRNITKRTIELMKDDLKTIREEVGEEMKEFFRKLQYDSVVLVKAAYLSSEIVGRNPGRRAVSPPDLSSTSKAALTTKPEEAIPASKLNRGPSPSERMQKLALLLKELNLEPDWSTASRYGSTVDSTRLSTIPDASPLAVLKGEHVAIPNEYSPLSPNRHWLTSDSVSLPSRKSKYSQGLLGPACGPSAVDEAGMFVGGNPNEKHAAGGSATGSIRKMTNKDSADRETTAPPEGLGPTPIRYKVLLRDAASGDIVAVDREEYHRAISGGLNVMPVPGAGGSSKPADNGLPPLPKSTTPQTSATKTISLDVWKPASDTLHAANEPEMLSPEKREKSRLSVMVHDLLTEAGKRGGLIGRSATGSDDREREPSTFLKSTTRFPTTAFPSMASLVQTTATREATADTDDDDDSFLDAPKRSFLLPASSRLGGFTSSQFPVGPEAGQKKSSWTVARPPPPLVMDTTKIKQARNNSALTARPPTDMNECRR